MTRQDATAHENTHHVLRTTVLLGNICVNRENVTGHLSFVIGKKQMTNDQ
jgi:hypothetical protein